MKRIPYEIFVIYGKKRRGMSSLSLVELYKIHRLKEEKNGNNR